ncbi:MAG: arginine--tRNA ligase [Bacteroidota bacterium]
MKKYLEQKIREALTALGHTGDVRITFERPRQEQHGDLTTNIAMLLAKSAGKSPRAFAQDIVGALKLDPDTVTHVEIAGPGFINFHFAGSFFTHRLETILADEGRFGRSNDGGGKKTQVEFVSANPTGPLSVGHGRQAAIGDTIATLLEWTGHAVTREYYYNNAGRQMRKLAESTYARYRQITDPAFPFPEDGYQGDYIREIAESLSIEHGKSLGSMDQEKALQVCQQASERTLFEAIKNVLARMGVRFDVFFNEDSLYHDGTIKDVVEAFRKKDLAYDKDGAVWLKTTALGLDQDRVIVKSSGEPTYRLPDIAYHRSKFQRGFELIVDIFGADHIATIPDVLAGIEALGYDRQRVKVVIHQFVTLLRDGQQVKMSKRAANFVTLEELLDEAGSDAVRFFFVMRAISSHLEFDLNLAKEQSDKNPVYYLQYAHARIASVLRFAESENLLKPNDPVSFKSSQTRLLKEPSEIALAKLLLEFPEVVRSAAAGFEPHWVPAYLSDVATAFHKFYHEHRAVTPDRDLSLARLTLCRCAQVILGNGLKILGISAPERM